MQASAPGHAQGVTSGCGQRDRRELKLGQCLMNESNIDLDLVRGPLISLPACTLCDILSLWEHIVLLHRNLARDR
jgi:hypothetical protein